MCAIAGYDTGCGEQQALEALEWAGAYGYELDPWQEWSIRNMMAVKPNGMWAAPDVLLIVARQNGKGTILEVRELAGLFCVGEKEMIHTAHQFKTSVKHFRRLKETINNYSALRRAVKRIAGSHGEESIELFPRPTLIFGSSSKEVRQATVGPTLYFHARQGASGSRGFSCDCLVYDEAMVLTDEQVGASLPTMSAKPNPQIIVTGSAGMKDSFQMAKDRKRMKRGVPNMFGAEWSIDPHTDSCPRDLIHGRESNYYITCDKHDDRDDPRSWAKANPATGYRIRTEFTASELEKMPEAEFDRERVSIGEWPPDEDAWAVISKEAWTQLSNADVPYASPPIAFAADIDEDGKKATLVAAWDSRAEARIVLEIPRNCSRNGSDWLLEEMDRIYKKWRPVAMALPKSGPGAALIEDAKKLWGDRLMAFGSGDEAAAFAWFLQQVRHQKLWHFGEEKAPTLWKAVAGADTRVVGDGGKAVQRRDAEIDVTPFTAAIMAAYALNAKRRDYDPLKSVAKAGTS